MRSVLICCRHIFSQDSPPAPFPSLSPTKTPAPIQVLGTPLWWNFSMKTSSYIKSDSSINSTIILEWDWNPFQCPWRLSHLILPIAQWCLDGALGTAGIFWDQTDSYKWDMSMGTNDNRRISCPFPIISYVFHNSRRTHDLPNDKVFLFVPEHEWFRSFWRDWKNAPKCVQSTAGTRRETNKFRGSPSYLKLHNFYIRMPASSLWLFHDLISKSVSHNSSLSLFFIQIPYLVRASRTRGPRPNLIAFCKLKKREKRERENQFFLCWSESSQFGAHL